MPGAPRVVSISPYTVASRFLGVKEVPGAVSNPAVLAMLRLVDPSVTGDEVPWCSAFVNYICWLLLLPQSKSLAARSWLKVGQPTALADAEVSADVVVLSRGDGPQPGPEVIDAPGHVGFYGGYVGDRIWVLGGNQGNTVSLTTFPTSRVLGVRRLLL